MEQRDSGGPVRLTAIVSGYVQGVGFRWSTRALAMSLKLTGLAENLPNGDVRVVVEGPEADCATVLAWLQGAGPRTVRRPGRVEFVDARWDPYEGSFRSFSCF